MGFSLLKNLKNYPATWSLPPYPCMLKGAIHVSNKNVLTFSEAYRLGKSWLSVWM